MDDNNAPDVPPPGDSHAFYQNFQHTPIGARVPEKIGRGVFSTGLMILQTNELFVLDFLCMGAPPPQIVSRVIMIAPHYAQLVDALRHNIDRYESQFGKLRSHTPAEHPPEPPPHSQAHDQPHGQSHGQPYSQLQADALHSGGAKDPGATDFGVKEPGAEAASAMSPTAASHSSLPPEAVTDLYKEVKFPEELMPGAFSDAVMIRHSPEEFSLDFICSLYPRPILVSRIYLAAGRAHGLLDTLAGALDRFRRFGPPPPPAPQSE